MIAFLRRQQLDRLQRGQSLVEMSLGFVMLMILVSGLVDLGRAYIVYVALEDGAAEAALYLSIDPDCRTSADIPTDGSSCADPNNAEYRARHAGGGNLDWSAASITISRPTLYGVGDPVSVTIKHSIRMVSPFMPRIAGLNPMQLQVNVSQIIIREK